jgi:hypothetical protein
MTREDAKFLCWYHLWNREVFGPEQAKKIANLQDTLYLFACIGLYNSSMGEVLEIAYKSGESPTSGDLPRYVLVQLHSYKGESCIDNLAKVIPIAPLVKKLPFLVLLSYVHSFAYLLCEHNTHLSRV